MSDATIVISVPQALDAFMRERARDRNFRNSEEYVAALIREDQLRSTAEIELAELERHYLRNSPEGSADTLNELRVQYWQRWQELCSDLADAQQSIDDDAGFDANDELVADIKKTGRERLHLLRRI